MATDCKLTYLFKIGSGALLCGTNIKLLSIVNDAIHSGNTQCKFNIQYSDGTIEDWIFQYPSAKYHLYKGVAFQVISASSTNVELEVSSNMSAPEPTCTLIGSFNWPSDGKDCCPGSHTGYTGFCEKDVEQVPEVTCTPIFKNKLLYGLKDCCPGTHFDLISGLCLPDKPPIDEKGKTYCIDDKTIAFWNDVTKRYDVQTCSTGKCVESKCVEESTPSPTPPPEVLKWKKVDGKCVEATDGTFNTEEECKNDTLMTYLIIGGVVFIAILLLRRK